MGYFFVVRNKTYNKKIILTYWESDTRLVHLHLVHGENLLLILIVFLFPYLFIYAILFF